MALFQIRPLAETLLELPSEEGEQRQNHIFEPEFHQAIYADACTNASQQPGAVQLGNLTVVAQYPFRGTQPEYADDENDPATLEYEGLITDEGIKLDGQVVNGLPTRPVCALKSVSIRQGYIDFGSARASPRDFYDRRRAKAETVLGDILINSTGDGTIGRVAVYNEDFPALVDGHITIVRLIDPARAWYVAAYLLSKEGQRQIYRYINGSSGQVEIYPQDIARIWVPLAIPNSDEIGERLREACEKYAAFAADLRKTLTMIDQAAQ
jgi:type I restriction enzyme M protein